MIDKTIIGKNIAACRKKNRLTQKELADLLNISYQAVSRWEVGGAVPTLEMMDEIARVFHVSIDSLVNEESDVIKDISYLDAGINSEELYQFKRRLNQLITLDDRLVCAASLQPAFFRTDSCNYDKPIYSFTTNNPGSKSVYTKMYGYDKELCQDLISKALNNVYEYGTKPIIAKVHIVCGNENHEKLWEMIKSIQSICKENDVSYGGTEIAVQMNSAEKNDYQINISVIGLGEEDELSNGQSVKEGDILIGIYDEGLESTCFPMIQVMATKKPGLLESSYQGETTFLEEICKPNLCYVNLIHDLMKQRLVEEVMPARNSIIKDKNYHRISDQFCMNINLSKIVVSPLYKYIYKLGFISKEIIKKGYCDDL